MLISPVVWAIIIYLSIGTYIMMEACVQVYRDSPLPATLKILASIISICFWPLIFVI